MQEQQQIIELLTNIDSLLIAIVCMLAFVIFGILFIFYFHIDK